MDKMIEIRDMLCDELEKFAEHGEINASALEMVDKLTHSIKSIDTILAMGGYSKDDMSYERGGSYARGRNSYERGGSRRSYERGNSRRDGRSYRGYSMAEHKDRIIEQLEDMMEDADAGTKAAIKKAIHSLEE